MSSGSSPDSGQRSRGVALLGSTGSIGGQVVEVLAAHPGLFRVVALATGSNAEVLAEQADRLGPDVDDLGPYGLGLAPDDGDLLGNDHADERHLVLGRGLRGGGQATQGQRGDGRGQSDWAQAHDIPVFR